MTYAALYARACRKGKLRTDEYPISEFIDDVNDLGRQLWTTIFQGVNGDKPSTTRTETITVSGDLNTHHTRVIKKTPISKIVFDDYQTVEKKTDKTNDLGDTTYEYDDDQIRFRNSANGVYKVFYEAGNYPELTQALYDTSASPDWIKDDFHPIFWAYPAFLNSDTRKEEMGGMYQLFLTKFENYYSKTETLESPVIEADDTSNQL